MPLKRLKSGNAQVYISIHNEIKNMMQQSKLVIYVYN